MTNGFGLYFSVSCSFSQVSFLLAYVRFEATSAECVFVQLQTCTHVFVNIDGNVVDDPLLEVSVGSTAFDLRWYILTL